MNNFSIPSHADEKYKTYLQQINALKISNIGNVIPKELYKKNVLKSLTGFIVSYCIYIGSIIGIYFTSHWSLIVILLISAGLGGWGLHCIGHDCGHGSFSNSRRLNYIIGHLSLIPLLYPFHAWRHTHNMHHGSTNHLEMDTDWLPISREIYDRMKLRSRAVYLFTRSVGFWAGSLHYWWVSAFRLSFYPKKKARQDVGRSMIFIIIVALFLFPSLIYYTGFSGLLLYFILPLISTHAWFSITTLMHHTAPDVPFLAKEDWSLNGSRILLTTNYLYPKWLLWLTHNISIHTAHHVAPSIPFFNLPKSQQALKKAYPSMIREKPFRLKTLWEIITQCHFYEPRTGYYTNYKQSSRNKASEEKR